MKGEGLQHVGLVVGVARATSGKFVAVDILFFFSSLQYNRVRIIIFLKDMQ